MLWLIGGIAGGVVGYRLNGEPGLFWGAALAILILMVIAVYEDQAQRSKGTRTVRRRDVKNLPGYSNGHEYEYFVAAYLTRCGYTDVKVTQQSGDYGADVLCTSPKGHRVAVQCKLYGKPVGYKAVEEAIGGMHYYGCSEAMVVTNNTYTKQAIDAARRMGVKLLERVG